MVVGQERQSGSSGRGFVVEGTGTSVQSSELGGFPCLGHPISRNLVGGLSSEKGGDTYVFHDHVVCRDSVCRNKQQGLGVDSVKFSYFA